MIGSPRAGNGNVVRFFVSYFGCQFFYHDRHEISARCFFVYFVVQKNTPEMFSDNTISISVLKQANWPHLFSRPPFTWQTMLHFWYTGLSPFYTPQVFVVENHPKFEQQVWKFVHNHL